jgi:Immunity protein 35
MIDLETAKKQVTEYLIRMETRMNSLGSAFPEHSGRRKGRLLITRIQAYDFGWVFCYNSKEFVEDGDTSAALAGNAPLIVDRLDGRIHVTGTAYPLDHYIGEYQKKRTGDEVDALLTLSDHKNYA